MAYSDITARFLKERDILGLQFQDGMDRKIYYFRIIVPEGLIELREFSLGSATPLAVAGTGWQEVDDASSRMWLEPSAEDQIYHFFWGVTPSPAWVYTRYPGGIDRNSLITTRAIGDSVGFIDGWTSPAKSPSLVTETFTARGIRPNYLGYYPFGDVGAQTVYMNFFIYRYYVEFLRSPTEAELERAVVRTPGRGAPLIVVPSWIQDRASRG